jgi:hypothetical protein
MIETVIGKYRKVRCAEAVLAVTSNPIRQDPWGALLAGTILRAARLLKKSAARAEKFLEDAANAVRTGVTDAKSALGLSSLW